MPHPLLKAAKRSTSCDQLEIPQLAAYDIRLGVWRLRTTLLARTPEFVLVSKKKDIETGEDNKGQ